MPILQHLCAGYFLRTFEQSRETDVDILEGGNERYHNYKEGYVTDSQNNLMMFVVNAGTRENPEWREARFSASSSVLGMNYRLVPVESSRKVDSPTRRLDCVQTFEGED
jgi:hypothetical protein